MVQDGADSEAVMQGVDVVKYLRSIISKQRAVQRPATMFGLETIAEEDVRYRLRRRQMIRCGDLEREQFKLDLLIMLTVWLHDQTT